MEEGYYISISETSYMSRAGSVPMARQVIQNTVVEEQEAVCISQPIHLKELEQ